jgi:hypothetical protein
MPEIHSKLSPSASDRWLACPASLTISAEDRASEYAAQGTVAHALASQCYLTGIDPAIYLDQPRSCDGYTIIIDQEMIDGVQLYLDFLESISEQKLIEQRIQHSDIADLGGTVDCAIPARPAIIDFKYGAGVAVEAENNTQLGCYALLMVDQFLTDLSLVEGVELIVVQPRSHTPGEKIKRWFASAEWLSDLLERVSDVAAGNRADQMTAGDHCRWCPARPQCPVLHEATMLTSMQEFRRAEEVLQTPQGPVAITPQLAVDILKLEDQVLSYFEAVRGWAHNQAEKGVEIPGHKLVQRIGNRRITDESKALKLLKKVGLGKKQLFKSQMLSPAQIEKLLSKEHKSLVNSFTERPELGTALVPVSDKREAVKRLTATEMFANAEGEN